MKSVLATITYLLLYSTLALGQGTSPSLDAIVQSLYPADMHRQISEDPGYAGYAETSCYAQYDNQTIIAAYSNQLRNKILVLQQPPGGTYAVAFTLTDPNMDGGQCSVSTIDMNGDGVPDIKVSFASMQGDSVDWFFTWNGTQLTSIGPTTGGPFVVDSSFVDVLHNSTLQLFVEGYKRSDPPEPGELYTLANGVYVPSPTLIAFGFPIQGDMPQPLSIDLPFGLPALHGPFTAVIANGDSQGKHTLQVSVSLNGSAVVSASLGEGRVSAPVSLQASNNILVNTSGAAGGQATVLLEEAAPGAVTLTGTTTSITIPETISSLGGNVAFAIDGLPNGVTAVFSPPIVAGMGDSVLTFVESANAPAGSYSTVVVATDLSSGQTQATPITIQTQGAASSSSFALATNTSILTVVTGSSNTLTVTQGAQTSFTDSISYSTLGLPPGLTGVFTPSWLAGSGTVLATFSASREAIPGTYSIFISGIDTHSGNSQVTPLQLVVNANTLPTGWNDHDVSAVGIGGSATYTDVPGALSVQGSGCSIANNCDQSHFVYTTLQGNWSLGVKVKSVTGGNTNSSAGLMMRDSLTPQRTEVLLEIIGGAVVRFSGFTDSAWTLGAGASVTLPAWLRVTQLGRTFTALYSEDASTWTQVGNPLTLPMKNPAFGGMEVTSGDNGAISTATTDFPTTVSWNLPSGWMDQDIGTVGAVGSVKFNSGLLQIQGSGCGIGSSCDQFNYAYMPIQGDWTLTADATGIEGGNNSSLAGLMIRDSLTPGGNEVSLAVVGGTTITLCSRTASVWRSEATVNAGTPVWLKLTRLGDNFAAYYSRDGVTWNQVGALLAIAMNSAAYAGVGASSTEAGIMTTATFSNIASTSGVKSAPPTISVTRPRASAAYPER